MVEAATSEEARLTLDARDPEAVAIDPDGSTFGSPVAVMESVQGRTPPDNPPYVFEGWLLDATDQERRTLQDSTVRSSVRCTVSPRSPPRPPGWSRKATRCAPVSRPFEGH